MVSSTDLFKQEYKLYVHRFDNTVEVDKILEKIKIPKFQKRKTLNMPITIKEIKTVIKDTPNSYQNKKLCNVSTERFV